MIEEQPKIEEKKVELPIKKPISMTQKKVPESRSFEIEETTATTSMMKNLTGDNSNEEESLSSDMESILNSKDATSTSGMLAKMKQAKE